MCVRACACVCVCVCVCVYVCACVCTVYLSPTGSMPIGSYSTNKLRVFRNAKVTWKITVHTVAIWEEPNRKPECSTTLTSTVKRKVAHVRKDSYYKSRNQDYAYICRQARQW